MLTILMETRNHEAELAQTLSVLVAGAVEGLVSDVVILDCGSHDGSSRVADAAGCRFYRDWEIGTVLESVRGDWLLIIEPGARPLSGWIDEIADYVGFGRQPARFSLSRHDRPPVWRRWLRKEGPLECGLLIARRQSLDYVGPGMRLADLATAAKPVRLKSEIVPARAMRQARDESIIRPE